MCEAAVSECEIYLDDFSNIISSTTKKKIVLLLYKSDRRTTKNLENIVLQSLLKPLDQLKEAGVVFKEEKKLKIGKMGRCVGGRGTPNYNEYSLTKRARALLDDLLYDTKLGRTLSEQTLNKNNLEEIVKAFQALLRQ